MIPDNEYMQFVTWYNSLPLNESFTSHDYPYPMDRFKKQKLMSKLSSNNYIRRTGYSDRGRHYYMFKKLKNIKVRVAPH